MERLERAGQLPISELDARVVRAESLAREAVMQQDGATWTMVVSPASRDRTRLGYMYLGAELQFGRHAWEGDGSHHRRTSGAIEWIAEYSVEPARCRVAATACCDVPCTAFRKK